MSQENVENLHRGLDAFNRRDRAAWLALCDPEYETVPSDDWPEMEPIRGPEAAWDFYIEADEPWERSPYEYVDAIGAGNDKVVAHAARDAGQGERRKRRVRLLGCSDLPRREGSPCRMRGDIEAMLDGVSEDVVWIAARSAVEGAYRGHDGLRRFLADNDENFEVFEPGFTEVRDLGDRILAFGSFRIRARGSGVDTNFPVAGIATYREGKLVRWEDFRERRLALEAAGLSE